MSLHPLNTSLFATSSLIADDALAFNPEKELYERRFHESTKKSSSIISTIIVIFISAILFVTIIAAYDILRNYIRNYYTKKTLLNKQFKTDPKDIRNTLITNEESLTSTIVFFIACFIIAIIFLPIFIYLFILYKTHSKT